MLTNTRGHFVLAEIKTQKNASKREQQRARMSNFEKRLLFSTFQGVKFDPDSPNPQSAIRNPQCLAAHPPFGWCKMGHFPSALHQVSSGFATFVHWFRSGSEWLFSGSL